MEYEPVSVSSQISTDIYGIETQERFKSCLKDHENLTLVYSPRVGDENITIKCYKEKVSTTTAYVQIAKSCVVEKGSVAVVKGKICHFDKEQFKETFILENAIELDQAIYTEDIKLESPSSIIKIPVYNESEDDIKLCKNDTVATLTPIILFEYSQQIPCTVQIDEGIDLLKERSDLSTGQKAKFKAIVGNYVKNVGKNNKSKIQYEHEIKLRDDEPVAVHARRLPYSQRKEIDSQIEALLEKGYIEKSNSQYAAQIVPVRKKDGSLRMCVDYRGINSKTVKCNYPVSRLEDLFERVKGCKVFSVLDLKEAYYHIPLKLEDRHKTAFVVADQKFQWVRMPFGLHGASFSLAAAMSSILGDCKEFCGIYYDDSIIFSCDIESHLEHLKIVFEKFAEFGLLVNLGKCQFIQESVTFLGHILSGEGIRPDIGKVQEILRFSVPKTCSEVKSFLGMASFFRKFVPHFSECAAPLFELLKKSRLFEWTDECERGFNFIKSKLHVPGILVHPQFDCLFIIHCDASGKSIGFMLKVSYKLLEYSSTHSLIVHLLFIAIHLVKPLVLCWHKCMIIC